MTMLVVADAAIEIQHTASLPESAFLRASRRASCSARRTGKDGKVYFPAREADPADRPADSTSSSSCRTRAR